MRSTSLIHFLGETRLLPADPHHLHESERACRCRIPQKWGRQYMTLSPGRCISRPRHPKRVPCRRPRHPETVSYTHLRAHETDSYLVCRLLLEKKKQKKTKKMSVM